jgi:hypothetical protein
MSGPNQIITQINNSFSLSWPLTLSTEEMRSRLAESINQLIIDDFQKLVGILYRLDVSEEKLKQLLNENKNEDTAAIIADLVIERQIEKLESRRKFKSNGTSIDEEEKW